MNSEISIITSSTSLPKTVRWNINDGDYIVDTSENGYCNFFDVKDRRKKIEEYSLRLTILATIIIILFVADFLSKI